MYADDYKRRKVIMMRILSILIDEYNLNNTEGMAALMDALAFIISTRKTYQERAGLSKTTADYLPIIVEEFATTIGKGNIN